MTAERLARDLLEKFCETFPHEIRRLRQDYNKTNQQNDAKESENVIGGGDDNFLGDSSPTIGTVNPNEIDVGIIDESEKEENPEELRIRKQERVMTVYHRRFDDIVSQLMSKIQSKGGDDFAPFGSLDEGEEEELNDSQQDSSATHNSMESMKSD
ncbi:hypothetical protein RFI_00100 [Reticulomyxa filosa]|uniref:Uncharacterized protein n=1 Tax=Reticulomyxa filosa TaxID=46433 RepID=X6PH02_RETFI|nr:hypothetical protein RFI_00100 [Reticulomyxa filosa]|eukprot:ETO36962.1 hypothetical protein RFI_00100 [Reticulomyxa filosa]